ncbi:MAG: ABC transporter permease [Flavobacteriales bacterium]|nr:ABC transporter permease [Flavobacteriales bacterium]
MTNGGVLLESFRIAMNAVRGHLLRTIITILIIAFGIMALVGILTAIDSIKQTIYTSFESMGANTFKIRNRGVNMQIGRGGKKPRRYRNITYEEAFRFKEDFGYASVVSISAFGTGQGTMKYKLKKTDPNVTVFGTDENYLATAGYDLDKGRNFSLHEVNTGSNMVIIGKELKEALFDPGDNPINEVVGIGSGKYRIIGVLADKGSSMGYGGDNLCIIPVKNVIKHNKRPGMSYVISVLVKGPEYLDSGVEEARGAFRLIRKVPLKEEDNFDFIRPDNLAAMVIEQIQMLTGATTFIGIITLIGAAIGLMNIMLVSVTERTREIGIRKAIGATRTIIRRQFLIEALVICQMGGLVGVFLGVLIGNIMSMILGGGFIVPWGWIIGGILLCIVVGLISGIYPAVKAARLDPIEALRYE